MEASLIQRNCAEALSQADKIVMIKKAGSIVILCLGEDRDKIVVFHDQSGEAVVVILNVSLERRLNGRVQIHSGSDVSSYEVRYGGASRDKLGIGGELSCGFRMLLSHVSKEGKACKVQGMGPVPQLWDHFP
ncbi:hypothetical protein A2U01_0033145 [Trifolium medium]|uniref:Uncharacterized protein n=1 Tax=Trifolium medium TaxID=97028 RepID=A0A392PJS9_9FABA|nr:hypothetical protein [Trifolium medium]